MEIGKYIAQALKIHPAVYVDQLGVFRKVHRPSTYDKSRQVYLPPLDYVEFDSLEKEGFPLSTFVQQSESIPKNEAILSVRNAVEGLRARAEEDGEVYLETLGVLIQYGNALIFKPQDLTGLALEPIPYIPEEPSEGDADEPQQHDVSKDDTHVPEKDSNLPITIEEDTPLGTEKSAATHEDELGKDLLEIEPEGIFNEEEEVVETTIPKEQSTAAALGSATVSAPSQQREWQEASPKTTQKNGIWYFVSALVLLGIIGGLWYYNNRSIQGEQGGKEAEEAFVSETPAVDSSKMRDHVEDIVLVDSVDTVKQTVATEVTEETAVLPSHHTWYIVIGAHRSYAQAEDEVARYRRLGHPHVRMLPKYPSDTFIRVIWDSYATKAEVDSALRYVQKNFVADAWQKEIGK